MAETPARKSMAPKRKGKAQYSMVSFPFEGFEGEFTLPKMDQMPPAIIHKLQNDDDFGPFYKFFNEYAPESVDAIESLKGDEFEPFFDAWAKASGVDEPGK